MTIQTNRLNAAQISEGGPVHEVELFNKHKDQWVVKCRGLELRKGNRLTFSDSKPTCKACARVKTR